MPKSQELGSTLRKLRESAGFSGRGLAKASGLSRESIRKFETGALVPSNQSLFKMLSALGVDPAKDEMAGRALSEICAAREKASSPTRSCGAAATASLRKLFTPEMSRQTTVDKLAEFFFEQMEDQFGEAGKDVKTESFEFFVKTRIKEVLDGG